MLPSHTLFRLTLPILFSSAILCFTAFAQTSSDSVSRTIEFVPNGWTFPPLIANTFEPRVGLVTHFNDNSLRLDIGNSVDLTRIRLSDYENERFTMGSDFFTYTALRGQTNFRFPVDAVDYLFGINFAYAKKYERYTFASRLRISHISAHLVDGSFEKESSLWRNGRLPRVYSREFFDGVVALEYDWVRVYGGVQYVFHVDPPELPKWSFQLGTEVVKQNLLDEPIHFYLAYDFKLISITKYAAVHSVQAGIKFGYWRGRGLNLFLAAYSGSNYHGEYFDLRTSYWGPGFLVEF